MQLQGGDLLLMGAFQPELQDYSAMPNQGNTEHNQAKEELWIKIQVTPGKSITQCNSAYLAQGESLDTPTLGTKLQV